jgi:argininosuccinate lyase
MLATDLSEYLVRKGVPFRETHHISGKVRARVRVGVRVEGRVRAEGRVRVKVRVG